MTNDLEKQFFSTFGIEPICPKGCTIIGLSRNCENCEYAYYPQITDRILLELICLNNRHYITLEDLICPKNIETIKESVLKKLIERNNVMIEEGYSGFCVKAVQALFEEEKIESNI